MIPGTKLFSSFSLDHLQRYSRIVQEGITVRRHLDLLNWLQGDVQHYLPHEIMLAAWGDFDSNFICYDIVSSLPGIRTAHLEPAATLSRVRGLHERWVERGRMPCAADSGSRCTFDSFLQGMRFSTLHGISDKRGCHDCLYVFFSSKDELNSSTSGAMQILLPYLDIALRRMEPLSHDTNKGKIRVDSRENEGYSYRLSEREEEIMNWVKIGKTNDEIAFILDISSFTVRNHLQHVFRKLEVSNRLQAVSRIERRSSKN
jgi:transcriptional regulator EpsA